MAAIKELQGYYPEVPRELLRQPRRNKQAEVIKALVFALEQSKFALETLNIRNGQCGPIIDMADAALALAHKGG